MIKKYLLIILTIYTTAVFGQDIYMVSKGTVKFTSDAPLELIEAQCNQLQGALKIADRSFVFRAPMAAFDGFNSALQKTHFNTNYLETAKYEYTVFEGKIIEEVDFSKPGKITVRGKGKFTCHGEVQERIIKCELTISSATIVINAEFTVLLDDHNIKIPSVVNQKIAEEIVVSLNTELKLKK